MGLELNIHGIAAAIPLWRASLYRGLGWTTQWRVRVRSAEMNDIEAASIRKSLAHAGMEQELAPSTTLSLGAGFEVAGLQFKGASLKQRDKGQEWEILLSAAAPDATLRLATQGNLLKLCQQLGLSIRGGEGETGLPATMQQQAASVCIVDGMSTAAAASAFVHEFRRLARLKKHKGYDQIHLCMDAPVGIGDASLACALAFEETPRVFTNAVFEDRRWEPSPVVAGLPQAGVEIDDDWWRGCAHRSEPIDFDAEAFKKWAEELLPVGVHLPAEDGADKGETPPLQVQRAVDTFLQEDQNRVIWKTSLQHFPRGLPAPSLQGFPPWSGLAQCHNGRPDQHGCVEVTLAGFKPGLLKARLYTLYSGNQAGTAGLHLSPPDGSTVMVVWSGRMDDWPICLGNVRTAAPASPDHFLDLPKGLWKWRTESDLVLDIGEVLSLSSKGIKASVATTMDVSKK